MRRFLSTASRSSGTCPATILLAFLLAILALAAAGCGRETDRPANLLLITLDTTRADRIGCYGDDDAATPNLDMLAEEGALFRTALSVGSITLPSHVSLLTGRYPPRHGVRLNGDFQLPGEDQTLAEHLRQQGYSTAAVVSAYVLSADFGIAQGFEHYDEPADARPLGPGGSAVGFQPIVERPANEVTDAALELLDSLPEPFFLWVHYYDPHGEYAPPEPYAGRFAGDPYAGEIAFVDAQIGRLFSEMRERDRLDETLIAVTADHGESLGEHGETTHGLFVYDATLHVPMLLRLPGRIAPGTRSDRLVSGVDLASTVLDLLELPGLDDQDGMSFAASARGEEMEPRAPVYAESELSLRSYGWAPLYALHDGEHKFIEAPQPELYDLRTDPDETRNLASSSPGELEDWRRRLGELQESWPEPRPEARHELDPAARERLSALGYVSGSSTDIEPTERQRADPKRMVQINNLLVDLQSFLAHGAFDEARELLDRVLKIDPENPVALEMSGTLLCRIGRCDEGIEQLQLSALRSPDQYQTQRNLGNALHVAGRLPEAARAYRTAIALHPRSAEDHYALGNVLFAMGDPSGAIGEYEKALELGLDAPGLHAALGVALGATGDSEAARASLQTAVDADPRLYGAWNRLGMISERQGELNQARTFYEKALESAPRDPGALFNYAKVSLRMGANEEADSGLRRLREAHPDYPAGRYLEAQLRLAQGDEAAARRALEEFLAQPNADARLIEAAREQLRGLSG